MKGWEGQHVLVAIDGVVVEESLNDVRLWHRILDSVDVLTYLDFVGYLLRSVHRSRIVLGPGTVRSPFVSEPLKHAVRAQLVEFTKSTCLEVGQSSDTSTWSWL